MRKWYHYILPKRLTLKCHPPVYRWFNYRWGVKDKHKHIQITNEIRENGHVIEYDEKCLVCGKIISHYAYGVKTKEYIRYYNFIQRFILYVGRSYKNANKKGKHSI